jgi:two-component system, NtrC family, nitrogen regulation sensor histidine kinase NtrY
VSARAFFAALAGLVVGGVLLFWFLERQLGSAYSGLGAGPELIAALEQSQTELKQLAALDSEHAAVYKARFASSQELLNHLRIVEHNREAIAWRFQILLLGIAGLTLALAGAAVALGHGRDTARLGRLRGAVERLARGEVDIAVSAPGRDAIGAVAAMVEEASRVVARDRRRLAALQSLESWQEAARRVLHELRTPLTSARLGLDRAGRMLTEKHADEVPAVLEEVRVDVDRLGELTRQFAGFARLGPPRLERVDMSLLVAEFATGFAQAWPNLHIEAESKASVLARADKGLLRQVLTNLCENASHALGTRDGTVTLVARVAGATAIVEVTDNGPGVPEALRERVFEPYVTSADVGEGLGLGLAISRKILLDHGGELELASAGPDGTVFRLTLPAEERS